MLRTVMVSTICLLVFFGGAVIKSPAVLAQTASAAENTSATKQKRLPDLNLKIVRFCERKQGQKVGSGECAVLVSEALKECGGTPRKELPGPMHPMVEDDYVWGTLLKNHDQILPGDILQFRDAELKYHYPDGATRTQRMPHHTAVVYKWFGHGQFMVLHQNIGGKDATDEEKRRVKADSLDIRGLQKGTIWAYRPRPKEE